MKELKQWHQELKSLLVWQTRLVLNFCLTWLKNSPNVVEKLREKQVNVNACADASQYFSHGTVLALDDFGQEDLDLEIAIRIVDAD